VTESGRHWGEKSKGPVLHVVVAAKDASAVNAMTRYKRILLQVQPNIQVCAPGTSVFRS
jgi:hypothetical protein